MHHCDLGEHPADFRLDLYGASYHSDGSISRSDLYAQRFTCAAHMRKVCFSERHYNDAIFREMPEGDILINLKTKEEFGSLAKAQESLLWDLYIHE